MSHLLALDPSVSSCGVALFNRDELVHCARVRASSEGGPGTRCLEMATAIRVQLRAWTDELPSVMTFEWPQIYRSAKSKGDPNDLIALAGVGMAVAAGLPLTALRTPTPAEWIGQCPKVCQLCQGHKKACKACHGSAWKTPRGLRIYERLTAAERIVVPDQHDAIDAVGLGMWARGRLTLARVFPGAI